MPMSFHGRLFGRATFCAILLLSGLGMAGNQGNETKNNGGISFTAQTQLVLIPAIVTDKSGAHIPGLTKDDFTVQENGVEQKIATFEEMSTDTRRPPHPSIANEFSNVIPEGRASGRITIIVLDFINTSFMGQARARSELIKYLTQSVNQSEPIALYTLSRSGMQVIHNFVTDPRVLVAALHKVRGDTSHIVDTEEDVESITGTASPDGSAGVDPGQVQTEAANIQTMLEDSELNFQSFEQRLAIIYTLQGLQQVAQALVGFPGRKSLIWAGGGFPFSVSDTTMQLAPPGRDTLSDVLPLYEHTWRLLNNAQIAIYPVDVNGVQVTGLPSASVSRPGTNYARHSISKRMDTQATFQTFASMTGGRAYYGSNDLAKGFREAVKDSAQYYMLGYYLNAGDNKPGWRKLAVKVKRSHVEVRSRSGFYLTDPAADTERSRNNDISSALQSPLDYSSVAFAGHWDKIEAGAEPGKKHLTYELELAPDPSLINTADNNHLVLEFVAWAQTPKGKFTDRPAGQRVDVHLTPERFAAIRDHGVHYKGALDLAPGEYNIRFVVRDDISGRTGSAAAPLKVE